MSRQAKKSWVDWFVASPRGKFLIKIDPEYLAATFNFYGLRQKVPNFKYALDLIRGPFLSQDQRPAAWPADIDDYGMCLYGLLHARYLLTEAAHEKMYEKYKNKEFPKCPRVFCDGICCLPYGESDDIGQSSMKIFCPNCNDVYTVNDLGISEVDGSFFGPSWVHLFIKKYPEIIPAESPRKYIPRIFGFKIVPPDYEKPDQLQE